jgi:hypothetical protein
MTSDRGKGKKDLMNERGVHCHSLESSRCLDQGHGYSLKCYEAGKSLHFEGRAGYLLFFAMLGMEPRAPRVPGKCASTELHTLPQLT